MKATAMYLTTYKIIYQWIYFINHTCSMKATMVLTNYWRQNPYIAVYEVTMTTTMRWG